MKLDTQSRFAFIETRLYWGEGVTARELAEVFGFARQTAQGVIEDYRRRHPEAIVFDASRKRQVAGKGFQPRYIRSNAGDFLDYVRGEAMLAHYRAQHDWGELPFCDVDRLLRPNLRREPIQQVLLALNARHAVTLYYQSKRNVQMRDVSPHHLIFAGNRYHLRGYCHLQQAFLDFVLSRIIDAEPSAAEWVSLTEDKEWNTFVELRFKPNAGLPDEVQEALRCDFDFDEHGTRKIRCRQALAFYIKRELLALDPRQGASLWIEVSCLSL
jgi:WYL domain-containing protein